MANVNVIQAFDLYDLDLNRVYEGSNYGNNSTFYDNANYTVGGTTYKDILEVL